GIEVRGRNHVEPADVFFQFEERAVGDERLLVLRAYHGGHSGRVQSSREDRNAGRLHGLAHGANVAHDRLEDLGRGCGTDRLIDAEQVLFHRASILYTNGTGADRQGRFSDILPAMIATGSRLPRVVRIVATLCLAIAMAAASFAQAPAAPPPTDRLAVPATDDGLPGVGPIRRYDWFQNLWRTRRAAWDASRARDQGAVVFLGDSITQEWGDGLPAAFPGVKVANRGISGDTTRGVLLRLDEDVLAINPSAVVLLIGTNDLEERATPEMVASNMRLILDRLTTHNPRMPIVLCLVFPSAASMRRPAASIRDVNARYLAIVRDNAQVIPLETWRLFADAEGDARESEFPDLLHPNAAGYAKWAAALRPILGTTGSSTGRPIRSTPNRGSSCSSTAAT